MRFKFFASDKAREYDIATAVVKGLMFHGHTANIVEYGPDEVRADDYSVAMAFGVKSGPLFKSARKFGKRTVIFDKGYCRNRKNGWGFIRFAVDALHPARYVMLLNEGSERWDALGYKVKRWRVPPYPKANVLLAGSSEKYHRFFELPHPTDFAKSIIDNLNSMPDIDKIYYRPKPSWSRAVPIEGSIFSPSSESILEVLRKVDVLVTHGSNACFEALVQGIPCVMLGPGLATPISSTVLRNTLVFRPYLAVPVERQQWFNNIAHCQWSRDEYEQGPGALAILKHLGVAR